MRLFTHCCLLWLLFVASNDLFAQIKIIEIDTLTGLPNGQLPFDEPFVLKIPVSGKRVGSLSYIMVNRDQDFQKAINIKHRPIEQFTRDKTKGIDEIGTPKKIGNRYYLFAQFRNPHLLAPGRKYTIFWTEDVSNEVLDLFDTYDLSRRNNDPAVLAAAIKQHDAIAKEYKKRMGVETSFMLGNATNQLRYYYDSTSLKVDSLYGLYRAASATYQASLTSLTLHTRLRGNTSLQALQKKLAGPTPLLDKSIRGRYLANPQQRIDQLQKLLTVDQATYLNLLNGIESIDCNECDATPESHIHDRAANIATTLTAVENILNLVKVFQLASDPDLADAASVLDAFQKELKKQIKLFTDTVVKARTTIEDALFTTGLSEPRKLNGDTFVPVFETRTKMSITPDIGLVTTRVGNNDGANPYAFVPYLGFHVNLRPINRDVPFWSYKHKPLHYFSLMAGYSLVTLDNGPKQSANADSVKSFFGGGKGAMLTGVGIRLGNLVRITAGTMWHFQYFPDDPTKTTTAYSTRKLKNWPFVGISIDMSLENFLTGVSDVFSQSPRRQPAVAPPAAN